MLPSFVVVVSERDPVAPRVAEEWGVPEATGEMLDGAPFRRLGSQAWVVKRPVLHVHDERLDLRLPMALRERGVTLVFPSVHRSERNVECLAVHPLGNLGPSAEVGGRARTLVPTDPRRMANALRRLDERAASHEVPVTYESTHHGPELDLPAFFVEIGFGNRPGPSTATVRALADTIPEIEADPSDRVAVGIGGGHYAPHFTDLALKRRWAFGHLVSRHALEVLDATTARAAWDGTPGAEGVLYARADDENHRAIRGLGPRLRDADAPARRTADAVTGASRSGAGT